MGRRRSAALALACWLFAGCTYTSYGAETSALDCNDHVDDDGDLKVDCLDPDCWGFARCRLTTDAGTTFEPVPPPSGVPAPPWSPPDWGRHDSSTPEMPDADVIVDASLVDAEPDAELPPQCSPYCRRGKCGDDGECTVPLELGDFEITSLELLIPRARPDETGSGNVCFDELGNCDDVLFEPLASCCPPDPTVLVFVGDEKAGSYHAPNTAFITLSEPRLQLTLRVGDEVSFQVVDDDNIEVGDREDLDPVTMFTCSTIVTLGNALDSGELQCAPAADELPNELVKRDYRVVATIKRPVAEVP